MAGVSFEPGAGCLADDQVERAARGSLTASERAAVESHLTTCAECRELVSALASPDETQSLARRPTAPPPALAADTIVGNFRVERRLGHGAMGDVYLAHDARLGRLVALKLLAPGTGTQPERWLREGRAQAMLAHPNVVAVHEAFTWEDRVVLALEFVEGRTLRQWLRDEKPGWRATLDALLAAGEGLLAAHRAGLVHRDFKPDNVLVGRDGRVRVADFGLAAGELADNAVVGPGSTAAGTPAYMAPEQFVRGDVGPAADQYAFCVTALEALTGVRPLAGLRSPAAQPTTTPAPPAWVLRRLQRGLARDPRERYPSLAELLQALRRDPRRLAAQVGVAVAIVALAASGWLSRADDRRVAECVTRGEAALARRWSPATTQPAPGSLAALAADDLNRYATSWREAWAGHCEAVARSVDFDGARSSRCLDRALSELGAAVALTSRVALTTADLALLDALPDPRGCVAGPTASASVEPLSTGALEALSQTTALARLGRVAEARAVLDTLGDTPAARAAALAELAKASRALGDLTAASAQSRAALELAATARDAELVARLRVEQVALVERGDTALHDLELAAETARLAIAQAGGDDGLDAQLAGAKAASLLRLRRPREARATLEAHLARDAGVSDVLREELHQQLSAALGELGEVHQAAESAELVLASRQRRLGLHHPLLAPSWKLVSSTARAARQYERAIFAAREEQALLVAGLGADHPSVHAARLDEAHALWVSGAPAEAEAIAVAAEAALRRDEGQWLQTARALNTRGACRTLQGDTAHAVPLWREAIALLEAHEATHTLLYGAVVSNLGGNLMEERRLDEAEVVLSRALEAHAGGQEPMAPLSILSQLGAVQLMRGELAAARQTLERALALCEAAPEKRCEGLHGNLGRLLVEEGRFREALAELERGLAFETRDDFDFAIWRFYQARARWELGERAAALVDARAALSKFETAGARGQRWRADIERWLATRERR